MKLGQPRKTMLCHHGGPALIDLTLSQKTEPLVFMLVNHRPRFAAKAAAQRIGRMGEVEDCIARCRRTIARWIVRSRQRRALRKIAEHNDDFRLLLKDIGVSQEEAFREVDKPFWRQ
jgi:uncharacterized protein YjiS (DUF1127 family)